MLQIFVLPATCGVETSDEGSQQQVTLKIYDILGNEVSTLVDEQKAPGNYEVEFKAENLSSGVYVYRLQTSPSTGSQNGQAGQGFTETKKMVLLR